MGGCKKGCVSALRNAFFRDAGRRQFYFVKPWGIVLILLCGYAAIASAQGVHVALRSNPSPRAANAYADVVASGNYAYLSTAGGTGVYIYDVSNPDAPTLVSHYPGGSKMEGIQVSNGVGYFGSDSGGGIHIVSLSDPTHPTLITKITSTLGGYDTVHDLTYDGAGHLFVPDYCNSKSVQVWNVSNPSAPLLRTTLQGTDSICVHDVTVNGNRLYMAGWGGTLDIWDITNIDTQAPTLLGSFNSGVHSQDVSLSADGHYLFCPREAHPPVQPGPGDVRVFDVSNPSSVTMVADLDEASLGISASSPSTSKVMGNLLFVAWYQNGLAIFDITDPTHPVFVGNYDTWPGVVKNTGDGNWGVWPYLGLDKVLVSDRTTGLYVLNASGISSQPAVFALSYSPASITGSFSSTGTIYLVGKSPSPNGVTINVTSNKSAANSGPVFIPANATSATFTQSTSSVASKTVATLTASDGTYSASANLTLVPPVPLSVTFSPKTTVSGIVTGTVLLNAPAAANMPVALNVTAGLLAIVPPSPTSVTVTAGSSSAQFSVTVHSVSTNTQVKITATANGVTKTGMFTVTADRPSSLTFNPPSVTGGGSTTGTVTFQAPLSSDTTVALVVVNGSGAVQTIPTTVTALTGSSSVQFTVGTNSVSASTVVKISATANGGAKTSSFTVN
jgi:hypothetical protein